MEEAAAIRNASVTYFCNYVGRGRMSQAACAADRSGDVWFDRTLCHDTWSGGAVIEGSSQVGPQTRCRRRCLHQLKKDCGGRHRSHTHPPNDQELHAPCDRWFIQWTDSHRKTNKQTTKNNNKKATKKPTKERWVQGGQVRTPAPWRPRVASARSPKEHQQPCGDPKGTVLVLMHTSLMEVPKRTGLTAALQDIPLTGHAWTICATVYYLLHKYIVLCGPHERHCMQ